jgi:hypothetical protein
MKEIRKVGIEIEIEVQPIEEYFKENGIESNGEPSSKLACNIPCINTSFSTKPENFESMVKSIFYSFFQEKLKK